MSKRSSLGAAERTALVLRLLAKEEPAAQIARRAGVSEAAARAAVVDELARCPKARLTRRLRALRVPTSVWHRRPVAERKSPGPRRKSVPLEVRERIKQLTGLYPYFDSNGRMRLTRVQARIVDQHIRT